MTLEASVVSTDLLLEPLRETRCRFREEASLSSKGYVRVEGSEEAARSRGSSAGSCSIWQVHSRARIGGRVEAGDGSSVR